MCKYMGWSYDELMGVPADIYDVLMVLIEEEHAARVA